MTATVRLTSPPPCPRPRSAWLFFACACGRFNFCYGYEARTIDLPGCNLFFKSQQKPAHRIMSSGVGAPDTAGSGAPEAEACPYLDTINRTLLDFDFEPSCSVTLESGPHVYGCLVCGKFFRGRGRSTPAYTHSVDTGHAVYVHLTRGTFHCLPDDYIVTDPSLADISAALHPTYTEADIRDLDGNSALARDLFGRRYLPGFVGLNNLNKTDYINATVQALAHVRPLRDYFLKLGGGATVSGGSSDTNGAGAGSKKKRKRDDSKSGPIKPISTDPSTHSDLAQCFGELIRKMWSDERFKATVDPHMFVQAVSAASKKRYHIGRQAEAGEFLAWLLHQLHVGIGGGRKAGSSIIHGVFQGTVEVTIRQRKKGENGDGIGDDDDRAGSDDEETIKAKEAERERKKAEAERVVVIDETTMDTQFLQLTLDIPEKPLFKDADGGLVIPQEPLVSVISKFDGTSFSDAIGRGGVAQKRRYRLRKLPNYLVLHLTRFKKNEFTVEKNPTIVSFPIKNLDLSQYVIQREGGEKETPPTEQEVRTMGVKDLKKLLARHGRSDIAQSMVEKSELVEACVDFVTKSLPDMLADKYDLVANITHHIPAEVGREEQRDLLQEGSYHCHVQHKGTGQWYDIQDLHVEETMPQLIGVSESYVLIFERKGLA